MKLRYFTDEDFRKATPACKIEDMDDRLLQMLDEARSICGFPFVINSAFRTVAHERLNYRSGYSSHTRGLAVDIKVPNDIARYDMIRALLAVGFQRMGIYRTFIHVDIDNTKLSPCIWHK